MTAPRPIDDRRGRRRALALLLGGAALLAGGDAGYGEVERQPPGLVATAELSCAQVSDCADRCGARCPSGIKQLGCLFSCKDKCRDRGGTVARKLFDPLTDCIRENCAFSCIKGPTAKCHKCTDEECAPERRTCFAQPARTAGTDAPSGVRVAPDAGR